MDNLDTYLNIIREIIIKELSWKKWPETHFEPFKKMIKNIYNKIWIFIRNQTKWQEKEYVQLFTLQD